MIRSRKYWNSHPVYPLFDLFADCYLPGASTYARRHWKAVNHFTLPADSAGTGSFRSLATIMFDSESTRWTMLITLTNENCRIRSAI